MHALSNADRYQTRADSRAPGFSYWRAVDSGNVAGNRHAANAIRRRLPLYVYFYPRFRGMSRLKLNGQRPTNALDGAAWLCSAQGVTQRMDLSGDIYGTYLNTDGNQMGFRLLDARRAFRINPQIRRYFDLWGRWHGPELVMQDDGGWERSFQPDPHDPKERASVTFTWGSYSDFKKLCAATAIPEKARIPLPRN